MPATIRRRIVRRAVMALAVVVLLPVGYVGSLSMLAFCVRAGWFPATPALRAYGQPWVWYVERRLPGSRLAYESVVQAGDLGLKMKRE